MNKCMYLLIWNLALTALLAFVFIQGGSTASKVSQLSSQITSTQQLVESLSAQVNNTRDSMTALQQEFLNFNTSTGSTIAGISNSLQKYVQDYVAAFWQATQPVK